jgi:hypothetical protein
MPTVTLRHDFVPDELSPARFFALMLQIALNNSTIARHEKARQLCVSPRQDIVALAVAKGEGWAMSAETSNGAVYRGLWRENGCSEILIEDKHGQRIGTVRHLPKSSPTGMNRGPGAA